MIEAVKTVLRPVKNRVLDVRDWIDGLRHPSRSERARERMRSVAQSGDRASDRPLRLLFVCLGNVCRSPYAEWSLRSELSDLDDGSVEILSAGFIGPGRTPPDQALEAARARGLDHETHCSQLVTDELLAWADAVFVFQRVHLRKLRPFTVPPSTPVFLLGDFDSEWGGMREIEDPWRRPVTEFHETFERIDRCLDTLSGIVRASR